MIKLTKKLSVIVFTFLISCVNVNASSYSDVDNANTYILSNKQQYEDSINLATSKIICYDLNYELMQEFINNPSMDTLNDFFYDKTRASVYDYLKYQDSVQAFILNDGSYSFTSLEKIVSLGTLWFIDSSFLEFFSIESLEHILEKNGLNSNIKNRVLIGNKYYPIIVLIETDREYYFLVYELDGAVDKVYDDRYTIYNLNDFNKRFENNYGKLIIDEQEINVEDAVLFWDKCFFIKTRTLLENLSGKTVIWNAEKRSVLFDLNGDTIEFFLDRGLHESYYINGENVYDKVLDKNLDSDWYCVRPILINGSLYYEQNLLNILLENYHKKCDVDYESSIVTISEIE